MLNRTFAALLALTVAGLAGPITREAPSSHRLPPTIYGGTFKSEDAFPGLTFPAVVGIVPAPGDTQRLYVIEQQGRIQVIPDLANPTKEVFLNIVSKTNFDGESGLLGLAFHPNFRANRYFYVFYTGRNPRSQRVSRFQISADNPNFADPASEQVLIEQADQASNHNGGDLAFGPDGYLYVSLGDEGGANDQFNNARFVDKDFFAGILRIDVDQKPGSLPPNPHAAVRQGTYSIPPDNPYHGLTTFLGKTLDPTRVRTEFWATGLRNPWRITFDPATGQLIVGDVGQDTWEEVDIIEKGGHHGWSYREGTRAFNSGPGGSRRPEGYQPVEPVWDYGRADGASVTGGVVYRGDKHPDLFGKYIFGDYVSGNVWAMTLGSGRASVERLFREPGSNISAFGVDPRNGDVLIARVGQGRIARLVRSERPATVLIPGKLSETGVFVDLATLTPAPGFVAYEPNVSFWSDHAIKRRWFALPGMESTIGFAAEGPWTFPTGTVWVKHFDLEMKRGDAASKRRLETRFLVKTDGGIYGLSYRWNEAQTDAELVDEQGADQAFTVEENGQNRSQVWRFPSRSECLACHTPAGGHALSFHTRQLNRPQDYGGQTANQLQALQEAGYFSQPLPALDTLPAHATLNSATPLEQRVRSYLAANCAQCHQPGAPGIGMFDVRPELTLTQTKLVDGEAIIKAGIPEAKIVAPGSEERSLLLQRLLGERVHRMPPIGSNELDREAIALVRAWIQELGKPLTGYDAWARKHFGGLIDPLSAKEDDPDRDARANYLEYLTGTDPRNPADFWQAQLNRLEGEQWELRFLQPAGVDLLIETSNDLSRWFPWQHDEARLPAAASPTPKVLTFEAVPEPLRFFRFRFSEPSE